MNPEFLRSRARTLRLQKAGKLIGPTIDVAELVEQAADEIERLSGQWVATIVYRNGRAVTYGPFASRDEASKWSQGKHSESFGDPWVFEITKPEDFEV